MLSNTPPTILYGTAPSPSSSSLQNTMLTNNEHTCKRISHLLKEESRYQCQDYLKDNDTNHVTASGSSSSSSSSGSDSSKSSSSDIVNAACRTRVCRWIFDTVDSLKMSHETALVAISNLDRYMSASTKARYDRKEYQLGKLSVFVCCCVCMIYTSPSPLHHTLSNLSSPIISLHHNHYSYFS